MLGSPIFGNSNLQPKAELGGWIDLGSDAHVEWVCRLGLEPFVVLKLRVYDFRI